MSGILRKLDDLDPHGWISAWGLVILRPMTTGPEIWFYHLERSTLEQVLQALTYQTEMLRRIDARLAALEQRLSAVEQRAEAAEKRAKSAEEMARHAAPNPYVSNDALPEPDPDVNQVTDPTTEDPQFQNGVAPPPSPVIPNG